MKKAIIIILIIIIVLAVGGAAYYFLCYEKETPEGPAASTVTPKVPEIGKVAPSVELGGGAENPLKDMPSTNPMENVKNPFKESYKNPFK